MVIWLGMGWLIPSYKVLAQTHPDLYSPVCREAIGYLQRPYIDTLMLRHNINPRIARAVVFPEVLRYNIIKDRIETMALKTLYVQYGSRYANFSIGTFQMKPSFAENLERELLRTGKRRFGCILADSTSTPASRKQRLDRLCTEQGQVCYLALFILVVQSRHPQVEQMSFSKQVRFYATAYNYSYRASTEQILNRQHIKEYHTDLFRTSGTQYYNYSDISITYFTCFGISYIN